MKIEFKKNGGWIDITPMVMFDWANDKRYRLYFGWIYWTIGIWF